MSGQMHQLAPVQKRDNLHARRKDALVQLFHLSMYGYKRFIRIRALAQQDDSLDGIVAVEYRAVRAPKGFTDLPQANLRPLCHDADVLNPNGSPVLRFD